MVKFPPCVRHSTHGVSCERVLIFRDMEINFLSSLDLLISFGVVMLLATSVVTAFVHLLLEILKQRTAVLSHGIARLLEQAGLAAADAEAAAEAVIAHRMVGADASVIQREKLIQVLLDLASRGGDLGEKLKKIVGSDPAQTLSAILARAGELEATHPHLADHVRQTFAIVENTKKEAAQALNSVLSWFDDSCDRMSHEFAKRSRTVTIVTSFAIAFALPLDSIELIKNLARDSAKVAKLVESASGVLEKADRLNLGGATSTTPDTAPAKPANPSGAAATTPDTAPAQPAKLDAVQAARETLATSVAELKAAASPAVPLGNWQLSNPVWWGGVVVSGLLMSLGAPFWFDVVKKALRLRSALAEKDAVDRTERVSAQEPVPQLPVLNRANNANSAQAGSTS